MKNTNKLSKYSLRKQKTFYRYVLSYLIVFLIPFSIATVIWYKTSTDSINNQIDLSAENQLLQVQTIISKNMEQLQAITKEISTNPELSEKNFTHPYYSLEARRELQKYKLNSSIIEEMYLHFDHKENTVYSSNGKLDIEAFTKQRYDSYAFKEKTLKKTLETTVPLIQSIPAKKNEQYGLLTYIIPLTSEDNVAYGEVLYTMKMRDIVDVLDQSIGKENGTIFILDANNQLLIGSHDQNISEIVRDPQKMNDLLKKTSYQTKEGTVRISSLYDATFSLRYVALTNTSQALSHVQSVQKRFQIVMVTILALGILLVILAGVRQYRPIFELERKMEKQLELQDEKEDLDDFARIQQHVATFLEQNKELHQEIRRQTPHAREQVLRKLLMGRFKESKEIDLLLESVGIGLYSCGYFVIVIDTKMVTTEASVQNQEFLMSFLDQISGENYRAYGTELLFNQAIALFVSIDDPSVQRKVLKRIVQRIVIENTVAPIIGVGTVVKEISAINRSYIESLTSLEYNLLSDNGTQHLFYDEIKDKEDDAVLNYPTNELLKLTQSLQQGDLEIASETITDIIETGIEQQSTKEGVQLYGFYLLNHITEIGIKILGDGFFQEAEKYADFRNLIDLKPGLNKMSKQICFAVQNSPKNSESQLQKDIFAYIDNHYTSHDFSLEAVAEEFDLSISYLSRFIKKEKGRTFSKYVQEKRLILIQHELRETEKPIKDIVLEAGYYDVSNYTRKFKGLVGMTPGQYRNKNR